MALLIFILCSCSDDDDKSDRPSDTTTSRVILAYMAAENNLSVDAKADFSEMLSGSIYMSDNDRLLVFYDDCDKSNPPCIYEIKKGMDDQSINDLSPVYKFKHDVNSASSNTLDEVMQYMYKRYEADEYGLIFWSHGSGWIPSNYTEDLTSTTVRNNTITVPIRDAFGVDTGNNSSYSSIGHQMNIEDMTSVLNKHPKTEFIMFDACFMQNIEIAYELKNCTKYIIASPAEIPGWGAPYQEITSPLFADKFSPNDLIQAYHSYYNEYYSRYGILLSVVDCSQIDAFTHIHREMSIKYREEIGSIDFSCVLNYFCFDKWNNPFMSHQYYQSDFPDFYDIKGIMKKAITDQADYILWEEELSKLIPHSCKNDTWYSSYPKISNERQMVVEHTQYSGLTMYVEQEKYGDHYFSDTYKQTGWAKAIGYGKQQNQTI